MAQIRVSEETYTEIVRVKARLEELTGRHLTFCDTLKYLCEMFHDNHRDGRPLRALDQLTIHHRGNRDSSRAPPRAQLP